VRVAGALGTLLFLLAGFVFLLLRKPEYPQSWYDHQRLMELIGLTLSAVFLPFLPLRSAPRLFRALSLVALVLLAVATIHGLSLRPVLIESLTLVLLVIAAIWWAGLIRTCRLSDALLLSAQLSIAVYVANSLLWLAASLASGLLPDPFDFFEGFINPRFFGAWVTLSWPLLLLRPRLLDELAPSLGRLLPGLLFVLAALWWSLVFFSGTRASWLAAAVMLALTALCSPAARRVALRGVLVIAAGFVLHQLLFVLMPSWVTGLATTDALDRLREGASLSNRDVLWRRAWQGILEQPWLGAGPMMFSATNNGIASTTHNIVLQLAYEWGVPFALLVIAATARALWRQFLRCRVDTGSFDRSDAAGAVDVHRRRTGRGAVRRPAERTAQPVAVHGAGRVDGVARCAGRHRTERRPGACLDGAALCAAGHGAGVVVGGVARTVQSGTVGAGNLGAHRCGALPAALLAAGRDLPGSLTPAWVLQSSTRSAPMQARSTVCVSPSRTRLLNHHTAPFLTDQSASCPDSSNAASWPKVG
jgi:O-antigen ligase